MRFLTEREDPLTATAFSLVTPNEEGESLVLSPSWTEGREDWECWEFCEVRECCEGCENVACEDSLNNIGGLPLIIDSSADTSQATAAS